MNPGTIITITFEDHGQDFLQWDICNNVVVGCYPFQSWMWVNCRLLEPMEALRVGHRPLFMPALEDMDPMRINYPIEAVEVRKEAEKFPCFLCGEEMPATIALEAVMESKDGEYASFTAHVCPICNEESRNTEGESQ